MSHALFGEEPSEDQTNACFLFAEACLNLRQVTAIMVGKGAKDDQVASDRINRTLSMVQHLNEHPVIVVE